MIYDFYAAKHYDIANNKIAIVAANFYQDITKNLVTETEKVLASYKVKNYDIYYVSGAFEVPYCVQQIVNNYDGIITLGAVIRGETPHFDYICSECIRGIMSVSLTSNTPISLGILTTNTISEAKNRSQGKNNKAAGVTKALFNSLYIKDIANKK